MNPYTSVAQTIALEVGPNIRYLFHQVRRLNRVQRSDRESFKQFFKGMEQRIADELSKLYPHHSINGAYITPIQKEERHQWWIAAVAGEENFRVGNPHFALTLAYEVDGRLTSAIIYNPLTEEIYGATRNGGATYNDHRIRIKEERFPIEEASLLTTFSSSERQQDAIAALYKEVRSIRVLGDIALDIGLVAQGHYDAYLSESYSEYAAKAAILVALEAGYLVTDFTGAENRGEKGSLLVSNPQILRAMLRQLR